MLTAPAVYRCRRAALPPARHPGSKGYAGFPVGGSFLVTENPDVVAQHMAKVYGKASVGDVGTAR